MTVLADKEEEISFTGYIVIFLILILFLIFFLGDIIKLSLFIDRYIEQNTAFSGALLGALALAFLASFAVLIPIVLFLFCALKISKIKYRVKESQDWNGTLFFPQYKDSFLSPWVNFKDHDVKGIGTYHWGNRNRPNLKFKTLEEAEDFIKKEHDSYLERKKEPVTKTHNVNLL